MDDAKLTFVQESEELLQHMEDALLAMEEAPDDPEHLNSVFRAMHTIKGAAGIFGFDFIVTFTHPVETVMDNVRSHERSVDDDLIALLLECKDHTAALVQLVADAADIDAELLAEGEKLLVKLTGGINTNAAQPGALSAQPANKVSKQSADESSDDHWVISIAFGADAFRNGLDPLAFIHYLEGLGQIESLFTVHNQIPDLANYDAESCYLSFHIAFVGDVNKSDIESVFEFALEDCELKILPPNSKHSHYLKLLQQLPDDYVAKLGEMLIEIGAITGQELDFALNEQDRSVDLATVDQQASIRPLGEILTEKQLVAEPVVAEALNKQGAARDKTTREAQFIRVDANRLGQLINLVGELVISNAAVKLMVEQYGMQEANEVITGVENLVEEIRDHALQLRMVQIGDTFSRFRRVVRDVSKDLQKDIDLLITGGDAELDKTVVEKINDPLTHLIRNSLDHGIEIPADRIAKGKSPKGTLRLNALHDSGHIIIQIADDGVGLDLDKIRGKAEAIGLVKPDQELSRRETLRLIFEPGLSTKEKASNLSGRGVGMDVVKRNIEELRGSVEVDSEKDKGTLITIQLPLTLAIIDGFMVGSNDERYVIPLSMVEECVEVGGADWKIDDTRHYVNLRGEVMPYIRLREFFDIPHSGEQINGRESLVVVRFGRTRAGIVVDSLFGELQTVIKPLGKIFKHLQGISGATVLGNGDIALILDVQGLVGRATKQSEQVQLQHTGGAH